MREGSHSPTTLAVPRLYHGLTRLSDFCGKHGELSKNTSWSPATHLAAAVVAAIRYRVELRGRAEGVAGQPRYLDAVKTLAFVTLFALVFVTLHTNASTGPRDEM